MEARCHSEGSGSDLKNPRRSVEWSHRVDMPGTMLPCTKAPKACTSPSKRRKQRVQGEKRDATPGELRGRDMDSAAQRVCDAG